MLKNLLRTTFGCFVPRASQTVGNVYGRRATALTALNFSKSVILPRTEQVNRYTAPNDGVVSVFAKSQTTGQTIAGIESSGGVWLSLINSLNGNNQCVHASIEKGESIRIHSLGEIEVTIRFTPFK